MTAITLTDMDCYTLLFLASVLVSITAWSTPFYGIHRPAVVRVARYAPVPLYRQLLAAHLPMRHDNWNRPKRGPGDYDDDSRDNNRDHDYDRDHNYDRDHDYDRDHNYDHGHKETSGVTGPVHTFVKTDRNANYKWGVRHHVGNKYAS